MEYLVNKNSKTLPLVMFYSPKWRWIPLLLLLKWILPKSRWTWKHKNNPTAFTVEIDGKPTSYPDECSAG